jgi:NAD(P)-dependent dehydrogenase (short-subunit alcohol dehydrogenase family)
MTRDSNMRLNEKVALITGAGQGIGAAGARRFAREGARVVVTDLNAEAGERCVSEIRAAGGEAMFVRCDFTEEDSVAAAIDKAVTHYGALDILYNNVGGSTPQDNAVTELPMEEFWSAIRRDLLTTFLACRHGIRAMRVLGRGGSVINTSSFVAVIGTLGCDAYTAAKGGVNAITRSMAVEYAPDRIRVNAIAPGAVQTDRMARFLASNPGHLKFSERNRHRRPDVASHLVGLVEVEDIAAMAVFLASDESRHITGTIQLIDSGASAS